MAAWNIETTDQFTAWYRSLSQDDQDAVNAGVDLLEEQGAALGRPVADRVKQSRFHNMKELIPPASSIRVLFAFDPRRTAILLIGGDKSGTWNEWYDKFVPVADQLYADYLEEIRREGLVSDTR